LTAVAPFTVVNTTVRPCEPSIALFFVVDVVALVLAAVFPSEDTLAFHLVLPPVADVGAVV
jgi:hypothetical protein